MRKRFIQKNILKKQLDPVIKHLSGLIFKDECILIDFPIYSACVSLDCNAGIKKSQEITVEKKPAFIIAKGFSGNISKENWQNIFSSPDIIILENKNRGNNDLAPLRWGLDNQEKIQTLKIARQSLEFFLKTGKNAKLEKFEKIISPRFKLTGNVGVALWTNGRLRGSRIIKNQKLSRAIIKAVTNAARDERFKPIEIGELSDIRIEITLISEIQVPLVKENLENNHIYPEKGYYLEYFNREAWYLPETFNILKFNNLKKFLEDLKNNKARLNQVDLLDHRLYIKTFEVLDFIESRDHSIFFDLNGPVFRKKSLTNEELLTNARYAADWLSDNQDSDGNISSIIDPLNSKKKQVDWPRLTLCVWALAEFGKFTKNKKYVWTAKKSFEYLKKYIIEEELYLENISLIHAYLGQLALFFEEKETLYTCIKKISINANPDVLDPISLQQISSFFSEVSKFDKTYLRSAINFARQAKIVFEDKLKNEKNVELALHAELANAYLKIFEITNEKKYINFSKKVIEWIARFQMEDGSFRDKNEAGFFCTNTRGTGKIVEILALFINHKSLTRYERNKYKAIVKKALDWIFSMQYNEENSYFIQLPIKKRVLGGIRHTYLDQNSWIDSVGHLLLGISRIIDNEGKIDLSYFESAGIIYPLAGPERLLIENNNNIDRHLIFFGKIFQFETLFYNSFSKLLKKLYLDNSDIKSMLGSQNILVRNCDYLLEYLAEEKIIEKTDTKSLLTYVGLKNAPGFFESNIKSKETKVLGRGFSKNWKKCLGQSLGEILERHFHFIYNKSDLIRASEKELKENNIDHINARILFIFSKKQTANYPKRIFDEKSVFYWEKCINLKNNKTALVPAHMVYCNYDFEVSEPKIREGNTSGLGGWFTPEGAILSGFYEIIQRDAFFYHWLNKITPRRINPGSIKNAEFKRIYKQSIDRGFNIFCLDLTLSDTKIPAAAVIIEDNSKRGPLYALGAGCCPDVNKAFTRALNEAWSMHYSINSYCSGTYEKIPKNYEPFITPLPVERRLSIWGNSEMKGQLDFFIDTKIKNLGDLEMNYPKKFKNEKEELRFALKTIQNIGPGYEVYAHLSKNKILRKAGFYSARVIVPELIPMYYNEENAPIENKRIKNKSAINTLPHLFP